MVCDIRTSQASQPKRQIDMMLRGFIVATQGVAISDAEFIEAFGCAVTRFCGFLHRRATAIASLEIRPYALLIPYFGIFIVF
ncbi:hypothetical protein A6R70_08495 [Agrobacterium rubi]|nr:hypothetical protein [Agrobacterium rubi]